MAKIDNRPNQRTINYFALGPLSVPLFAASFLLTRKLHMVSLAFKSWLVFPTCFSTSYCSPPGQVCSSSEAVRPAWPGGQATV